MYAVHNIKNHILGAMFIRKRAIPQVIKDIVLLTLIHWNYFRILDFCRINPIKYGLIKKKFSYNGLHMMDLEIFNSLTGLE